MADKTGIEWTDATWNPIRGCSRVSDGCRYCYAERVAARFSGPGQPYEGLLARGGQWNGQIKLVESVMDQPLRWRKQRRIFVNSMSDLFHENVPDDVIARVFAIMSRASTHTFQILTKRPERMRTWVRAVRKCKAGWITHNGNNPAAFGGDGIIVAHPSYSNGRYLSAHVVSENWPLPNVWLGVSVENQATANERIPLLLETPAAVRWISAEPLLGSVDLTTVDTGSGWRDCLHGYFRYPIDLSGHYANEPIEGNIDWVVVGGESGPGARPMHPDWARAVRNQCQAAGVPFLFKQWGEWAPEDSIPECDALAPTGGLLHVRYGEFHGGGDWIESCACSDGDSGAALYRVGKKAAGRMLDGRTWDEYPEPHPCQPT